MGGWLALIARYWRAGLAIAAAVAVGVLRAMWRREGRQEAEQEAVKDAYEAERERTAVDADVARRDAVDELRKRWSRN